MAGCAMTGLIAIGAFGATSKAVTLVTVQPSRSCGGVWHAGGIRPRCSLRGT